MTEHPTGSRTQRDTSRRRPFRRGLLPALTMVLVVLGCAVGLAPAHAADVWTDISDAQWVADYGITAQQAGTVADGYPDNTFKPYASVTRGQFAKMSVQGLGIETRNPSSPTFSDVPRAHLFYRYVEGGSFAGIMGGFPDGTFRPDRPIERQQSNSILGRYLAAAEIAARGGIKGDVLTYTSLSAWYMAEGNVFYLSQFDDQGSIAEVHRPATAYLVYRGVVHGSNDKVTPTAPLTRAQGVALVLRTLEAAADVTTPPPAPTGLATMPVGPANDSRPFVTGQTIVNGRVAIYDTFAGATTELVQGTADSTGHFTIRVPALFEGLHSFTAKAKDAAGLISSASAPVAYLLDLSYPEGEITSPTDGGGVASRAPDFTASALDEGSGIEEVRFEYRAAGSTEAFALVSTDSVAVGGLYQAVWGDRSLPDGAFEFRAILTDLAGNETVLGPIDAVVDMVKPSVELQAPSATGVFYTENRTPLFAAAAADAPATPGTMPSGVARVDFFYHLKSSLPADPADWTAAEFTLLSSDDGAGYSADWGAVSLVDGRYVFAVQSVDAARNLSALDTQEVVVDNLAPVVTLTAPIAGAILPDNTPFTVTWTATDVAGVDTVKLEYSATDGDTWNIIAEAAPNTGAFGWDVPNVDSAVVATFKLRLTAVDLAAVPVADLPGHTTELTSAAFSVREAPAPATGATVTDTDVNAGVDGRDFHAEWVPSPSTDGIKQHIFILPAATPLDLGPDVQVAMAEIDDPAAHTWTGLAEMLSDSAGALFVSGEAYRLYTVTEDPGAIRTPSAGAPVTPVDP